MPSMLATLSESYNVKYTHYLMTVLVTFIVPMALAFATYSVRVSDEDSALYHSVEWQKRMQKSGCDADKLDPAIILHHRHFEHSAIIAIATGAILG
mmetsp:Transcript_23715/g.29444  ORF Transcript_23715/g.29444 Transcript_23715/m.29444 type:complete len:96 (-) Transcript_23715:444-731(-)